MAAMTSDHPPVILLHGWGGSPTGTFNETGWIDSLEQAGRKTIAISLPGHGPDQSADPLAYGNLLASIAPQLPSVPVDVIGYSLGAKLALGLACTNGRRVRRVVLGGVGDNLFAPEPDSDALAADLLGLEQSNSPAIAALKHYALANNNEPAPLAAVLQRPPNPVFSKQHMPDGSNVLLVNSQNDFIAMPDRGLQAAMPQLTCIHIEGCSHLDLPSDDRFAEAALQFLQNGRIKGHP